MAQCKRCYSHSQERADIGDELSRLIDEIEFDDDPELRTTLANKQEELRKLDRVIAWHKENEHEE